MQTHTFSTGDLQISIANRLLLEAEITTKIGTIDNIEYSDTITIVIVEELDTPKIIELYNIVTSYLIYRPPEQIKNEMCAAIDSLTLTELNILDSVTSAIYERDAAISLKRKLCKIYQEASDEELLLYDDEFTRLALY